jgi:uncharacterized protein (TIGR02301 family)
MMPAGVVLVALLIGLGPPLAALAQQEPARPLRRKKPAIEAPDQPQAPALPQVSPHEGPLVQLSELMGALAFLSGLCATREAPNPWARRMEEFLEAEGENAGHRARLTGAYNQGFSEFSTNYRQCTDAARAARALLERDAARLAREIERRFGT